MLVKALNLAPEVGPAFSDTQGTWAQSYVATVYGIVGGYDSSHFGPNTRSPGSGSWWSGQRNRHRRQES